MAKEKTYAGKSRTRASRVASKASTKEGGRAEGIKGFFEIVHHGDSGLVEAVKRGIPVTAVDTLIKRKVLTKSEIDSLVMPRRTLAHRERRKEPLNAIESERLLRIARIIAIAEDTFANSEKAAIWLRRPNRLFGGKAPLAMADTEPGGRMVEGVLRRIAHGIAA